MEDFNFAFSDGLYLLLGIIPLLIAAGMLFHHRQKSLRAFIASDRLQQQTIFPRSRLHFLLQTSCFCLGWFFAVIALMGPQGDGRYIEDGLTTSTHVQKLQMPSHPTQEVVFFLDTSASMSVTDTHSHIPRIDYAKEIIDTAINDLKGATVAIYAFTSEVTPLVPTTFDYFFARLMLNHASINEGDIPGTDLLKVTQFIQQQYINQRDTPVHRTIILLSDGGDTLMESLPPKEKALRQEAIIHALEHAKQNHVTIHTIGIGSLQGQEIPFMFQDGKPVISAVEEGLLKQMAETTGGKYHFADHYTSLLLGNALSIQLDHMTDQDTLGIQPDGIGPYSTTLTRPGSDIIYDSYYQLPLALAIFFFSCSLLIPDIRRRGTT